MRRYGFPSQINEKGITIYDDLSGGLDELWIPSLELQEILSHALVGFSTFGMANRTRSKVLKEKVCAAMGYPIPKAFTKKQPRFPGQNFDIYVQKTNNLQIWNQDVSPTRRYVIIAVASDFLISKVTVLNGEEIAKLYNTGTLTKKYQARLTAGEKQSELVTPEDTEMVRPHLATNEQVRFVASPTDSPVSGELLPIASLYKSLSELVGKSFPDAGRDQERNRGAALHSIVCAKLGYKKYGDNGKFPDIRNQLLEIKLQTSPTIDLGVASPDGIDLLDVAPLGEASPRYCDVRYAVFSAVTDGKNVTITGLYLTTGMGFFQRFPRFEGNVINSKLQIRLPSEFFV